MLELGGSLLLSLVTWLRSGVEVVSSRTWSRERIRQGCRFQSRYRWNMWMISKLWGRTNGAGIARASKSVWRGKSGGG